MGSDFCFLLLINLLQCTANIKYNSIKGGFAVEENKILKAEDYFEPACPFCVDHHKSEPPVRSVPTDRILSKLDEYLGKDNYSAAERHLLYWLDEAKNGRDSRGMLLLNNELMGLYRKLGQKEKSLACAETALEIVEKLSISDNPGAATTFLNSATVYKAFGMAEKSIPLFEKAYTIYKNNLDENDERFGGLYNNMALAYVDLKEFAKADELYRKALSVMKNVDGGEPEQAITLLNMANAAEAEHGLEDAEPIITEYLEEAMELLDRSISETDGNYAFVCSKCSSVFGYYGYFFYQNELERRAKRIYERT